MAFTKMDYCPLCDRIRTVKQSSECKICNPEATEEKMKDDSLDDTVNYSIYGGMQTPKPDAIKALAQSVDPLLAKHQTAMNVYEKEVWNAAIEAAAGILDAQHNIEPEHIPPRITGALNEIRKLKK